MKISKIVRRFRIDKPDKFRLADVDPADTCGLDIEKAEAKALLADGIERLSKLQEKLYAQNQWAVLVVFQAMDAAGKDGAIKHVMSGVNPQGCQVHAFKQPSAEELDHDFLWRIAQALPERGRIGIFNRSHYEDVLVARVHPEVLARQRLPKTLLSKDIWDERFKSIRAFERHLAHNGVMVLKFFLHISKEEQRKRFLARLDEPAKRWKFEMGDVVERKLWDKYMRAYEDAIRHTSRREAPWYVVPANDKRFARLLIAEAMVEAMETLKLEFPKVEGAVLKELEQVRGALEAEAPKRRS
jgi:PPK2 family polyphosphate:nucleotide phosphotransferase